MRERSLGTKLSQGGEGGGQNKLCLMQENYVGIMSASLIANRNEDSHFLFTYTFLHVTAAAVLTNGHPMRVGLSPSLADLATLVGIQGD